MLRKIKKLFSFLSLVLLGLLSPIHFASASWVTNLLVGIPTGIVFFIIKFFVEIEVWLVGLTGSLLNWVLGPNFISISYTNPGGPKANLIIKTGLDVTQGFVNMLLVLVLVYIAIATILRLAGYETKKLLVTFIIVALLVNFAPVICGLIVDASNIIMNFFVQDLKADAFGTAMGRKLSDLASGFEWTAAWETNTARATQIIVMLGFLWYLILILLIFIVIFVLRYLVIWLLVILSPLAFVCYILPVTRKYFEQWWQQFLAWSFIGVTCGFFLYLGLLMVSLVPTAITAPTTSQGGLLDSILPFFVSGIFLGLGIVFGLQTSAMGAKVVVQGARRGGKAAAKKTAGKTYQGMKTAAKAVSHETRRIQRNYQAGRALGLSRPRAAGEAIARYTRRKLRPSPAPITIAGKQVVPGGRKAQIVRGVAKGITAPIKMTAAAGKGVLSAAKDVAIAGTAAAFKIKLKKKGLKKCSACGNTKVAKSAKSCPTCGYDFGTKFE